MGSLSSAVHHQKTGNRLQLNMLLVHQKPAAKLKHDCRHISVGWNEWCLKLGCYLSITSDFHPGLVLCCLLWAPPWRKSCVIKPSCPGPRHPLDRWSKKVKFEVYDFFLDFFLFWERQKFGASSHPFLSLHLRHPPLRWIKKVKPQIVTCLRSSNEKTAMFKLKTS